MHISAMLGAEYQIMSDISIAARLNSSYLQAGLYGMYNLGSLYGMLGAAHSFDFEESGISYGLGYRLTDSIGFEAIKTNYDSIDVSSLNGYLRY